MAQTAAPTAGASQADRIAALEKQNADNAALIAAAQTAGDSGWMLVSAALVLMMSGPGLALFYGGLVRKKNILGTMMQTFAMMAVITVLWALVTYSLALARNALLGVAQCVSAWGGCAGRSMRRRFRCRRSWCIS
jgi:Amt family ammonium transporter